MKHAKQYLCLLSQALAVVIATYFEYAHIKLYLIIPKNPFQLLTDIANFALTIIFPWNGWVFLFPAIIWLILKQGVAIIVLQYISVVLVFGVTTTFMVHRVVTGERILGGILFDGFIYGIILMVMIVIRGNAGDKK